MNADARGMGSRQAGFSVVEVLVALALLAVVLALTSAALNASRYALRRVLAQNHTANFVTSMRFVEQRLTDAQPLYETRAGNKATIYFSGDPDRVVFLAAVEGAEFAAGLYRVEFGQIGKGPHGLALRITSYAPNLRSERKPIEERTIDPAISSLKIQYFGPSEHDGLAAWHESWRDRNLLPYAIHVEAKRRGKSTGAIYVPLRPGRSMSPERSDL